MTGHDRRRRLDMAWAGLMLAASLAGLARGWLKPGPDPAPVPPAGLPAVYRPDGGQALRPDGSLPLNALTRLNLGRRVELTAATPAILTALPGFASPRAAERVIRSGCLSRRQRARSAGLIQESCARNNP